MLVEKSFQGAFTISSIVNGEYVWRQYFFYTEEESVSLFKREMNITE